MNDPESGRTASSGPPEPLPDAAYSVTAWGLRLAVIIAFVLLLGGLAAYVLQNPAASWSTVTSGGVSVSGAFVPRGIVGGLVDGNPVSYMALGVLVLVAAPVVRIGIGTVYIARSRERELALVGVAVLALLLAAL
ncbi:MAG: DUF1634 domain-containing protein, partial [Thermoplasmata archaeon]|nr:DUF1634 domain-containing protein [Thermoplasmata archaeon]